MQELDNVDIVLICLAVLALGGHLAYSRWKKFREEEERRRLEKNQPQLWSDTAQKSERE